MSEFSSDVTTPIKNRGSFLVKSPNPNLWIRISCSEHSTTLYLNHTVRCKHVLKITTINLIFNDALSTAFNGSSYIVIIYTYSRG